MIDQKRPATLFMDSLDTNIHAKFLTDTHNHAVNEVKDYPSSVSEVIIRIDNYMKSIPNSTDVKQLASSTMYAFGDDIERENDTSIKPCFDFQKGKCERRNNCRYSHAVKTTSTDKTPKDTGSKCDFCGKEHALSKCSKYKAAKKEAVAV